MHIPVITLPALAMVTGAMFIYGGIVRLRGLRTSPPSGKAGAIAWGVIGIAIGVAIIAGAIMLYFGA